LGNNVIGWVFAAVVGGVLGNAAWEGFRRLSTRLFSSRMVHIGLGIAVRLMPRSLRGRYAEEWAAEVDGARTGEALRSIRGFLGAAAVARVRPPGGLRMRAGGPWVFAGIVLAGAVMYATPPELPVDKLVAALSHTGGGVGALGDGLKDLYNELLGLLGPLCMVFIAAGLVKTGITKLLPAETG
jgi:hypothetical protein